MLGDALGIILEGDDAVATGGCGILHGPLRVHFLQVCGERRGGLWCQLGEGTHCQGRSEGEEEMSFHNR